jgi:hypothetical protein
MNNPMDYADLSLPDMNDIFTDEIVDIACEAPAAKRAKSSASSGELIDAVVAYLAEACCALVFQYVQHTRPPPANFNRTHHQQQPQMRRVRSN